MKRYIPMKEDKQFIETSVFYELGGLNCFTANYESRGIKIMVVPVEIDGNWIKTKAFNGFKYCLKEMKRGNSNELKYAEDWLLENYKDISKFYMIEDESESKAKMFSVIKTYGQPLKNVGTNAV